MGGKTTSGGLSFVLVGMALGGALTFGGLWLAQTSPEQLMTKRARPSARPAGSLARVGRDRPRTLEERMQPVQAACEREYGYDPGAVQLCVYELRTQIEVETSNGTAPEDLDRFERAQRAAGIR